MIHLEYTEMRKLVMGHEMSFRGHETTYSDIRRKMRTTEQEGLNGVSVEGQGRGGYTEKAN